MSLLPRITGLGLVTPLGRSVNDTWNALLAGRSITTHTPLSALDHFEFPPVVSLGIEAASEAMADAGWNNVADNGQTAVIVGTSKGPVERWLTNAPPLSKSDNGKTPAGRLNFGLAEMTAAIATETGLVDGPRLTLSAACASGLHALIRGCMMIQSGQVRRALIVAAEASVHPLFLASFERLCVLSPAGTPCRPFDVNRQGFLMSDAAAAVCLEASDDDGMHVDCFALGGDATHLTGSKSDGAVLSKLLSQIGLPWDQQDPPTIIQRPIMNVMLSSATVLLVVDLIHAHGTGTKLNDAIECMALGSRSFLTAPTLFSHKGALGHSLGASGLVSVVINCMCHRHGRVPGNVNTNEPMSGSSVEILATARDRDIRNSIVISSGFGGPTAVVSLRSSRSS